MNLFETKGGSVQIQPEAYVLTPFKTIWDRDKSKGKDTALVELGYVYFMADYRSDYTDIVDDEDRSAQILKDIPFPSKWKPDKIVNEAIKFYRSRQETVSLKLLENARAGIDKLSKYLKDINFNETTTNKAGEILPKHDIKKFADTIKQIPSIVNALNELEEAIKKERESQKGLRGGKAKGMYADGEAN